MTSGSRQSFSQREQAAMARAVELAGLGEPTTKPNPNAGCVVLDKDGGVAGEGWHERAGGPHAEVLALAAAGDRARGGTVVVSLEPCHHVGRTGPCTAAILDAGASRVVYAVADPTALAGGGGAALAAAGVDVASGLLAAAAERVNERWLTVARLGRPYVIWKFAATLDGRVAAADGTSRWITGRLARKDVHLLRARCDAIVAGIGTVLADDPHLTTRNPQGELAPLQPLRVVVDTHGRTPFDARVRDAAATTLIATADEIGVGPDRRIDLMALLKVLAERDCQSVLLEGGPTLAGGFVKAGLVDRVIAYIAPALLGAGPAALDDAGITTITDAMRLDVDGVRQMGADVRITARVRRREQ